MKPLSKLLLFVVVNAITFSACKKQNDDSKLSTQEVAKRIYGTQSFRDFAVKFATDFKSLTDYFQAPLIKNNPTAFLNKLKTIEQDEAKLESFFKTHSLSFEELVMRKYKVDNDLLKLFHEHPVLLEYSDTEIWEIIKTSVNLKLESGTSDFLGLKSQSEGPDSQHYTRNSDQLEQEDLTLTEVWGCLKEALGFGGGSMLGILGLKELAKKGVHEIVITGTKFLAKHVGWIGLAITAIDFSICIYGAV